MKTIFKMISILIIQALIINSAAFAGMNSESMRRSTNGCLSPKISMDMGAIQNIYLQLMNEQNAGWQEQVNFEKEPPVHKGLKKISPFLIGQVLFAGILLPFAFGGSWLLSLAIGALTIVMYLYDQVVAYRWLGLGIIIGEIITGNFIADYLYAGLVLIGASFMFQYLGLIDGEVQKLKKELGNGLDEKEDPTKRQGIFSKMKDNIKLFYWGRRLLLTKRKIERLTIKVSNFAQFAPQYYEENEEAYILKVQDLIHKVYRIQARFLYFWLGDDRENIERFIERCDDIRQLIWLVYYNWYHKLKKKDYYGYSDLMMEGDGQHRIRLAALSRIEARLLHELPYVRDDLYGLLAAHTHPVVSEKAYWLIERMETDPQLLYRGELDFSLVDTWKKAKDFFYTLHRRTYYYLHYIPILEQDEDILEQIDFSFLHKQKLSDDVYELNSKEVRRKKHYFKIFYESVDEKEVKQKMSLGEEKAGELWEKLQERYGIADDRFAFILKESNNMFSKFDINTGLDKDLQNRVFAFYQKFLRSQSVERVLYQGSGADIIVPFMLTNTQRLIMMDHLPFGTVEDAAAVEFLKEKYLKEKREKNVISMEMLNEIGNLRAPIMWELECMNAQNIDIIVQSSHLVEIRFSWAYPGEESKERTIILAAETNARNPQSYPVEAAQEIDNGIQVYLLKGSGVIGMDEHLQQYLYERLDQNALLITNQPRLTKQLERKLEPIGMISLLPTVSDLIAYRKHANQEKDELAGTIPLENLPVLVDYAIVERAI